MALPNGPDGYGAVTKVLHWATVVALLAQFTWGYLMDVEDDSGRGRGRGRGRGGESGEDGYDVLDDWQLTVHVALGGLVIALALVRLVWRRSAGLPPWAEQLSTRQRRVATLTERALLTLLLLMPASGIALVLTGDDDLVWLHVTAHVAFFAVLVVHLTLNLRPAILRRMV